MNKWKVFCWLLVVAIIAGVIFTISQGLFNTEIVIGAIVGLALLVPYFGYAYQKRVGALPIWRIICVLQTLVVIVLAVVSLLGEYFNVDEGAGILISLLRAMLIVVFAILLVIPPFLYSFKSAPLWEKTK